MNPVILWTNLVAVIEPVCPKAENPGCPPGGVERGSMKQSFYSRFELPSFSGETSLPSHLTNGELISPALKSNGLCG